RPALAHTQREYGKLCLRRNDGGRAAELLGAATATYASLGMTTFVERTRALGSGATGPRVTPTGRANGDASVFVREGDYWTVTYERSLIRLKDGKGVRYVAELLRYPGRRTHVLDLIAAVDGAPGDGEHRSAARLAGEDLVARRPGAISDAPDARART